MQPTIATLCMYPGRIRVCKFHPLSNPVTFVHLLFCAPAPPGMFVSSSVLLVVVLIIAVCVDIEMSDSLFCELVL